MRLEMDIDIDVPNREEILSKIPHVPASIIKDGEIRRHNVGVYFQDIPVDPDTQTASIDYRDAEELGYMKFDFINNTIYKGIRDPDHLDELVSREPSWELLESKEFVSYLAHIHEYSELCAQFKPKSVLELAALIALIRPGKRYLQKEPKSEIMKKIWLPEPSNEYVFKKSHSVAYALSIVVQMNLLVEGLQNAI